MLNHLVTLKWGVPIFVALAFFGALFWAKSDDPYHRIWFNIQTVSYGNVAAVAILPKPIRLCPVVIYLHGAGGNQMKDGAELRVFAELGIAAIGLEYDQTNEAAFDEQFLALTDYLKHQPWVMSNAVAWVGFSLGAQRTLSFILKHPEIQPQLYVRMSGGWLSELDSRIASEIIPHSPLRNLRSQVLLIHGGNDAIFPVQDIARAANLFRTNGIQVTTKILPGEEHDYGVDKALVTRLIAEYCKLVLTPEQPFDRVLQRRVIPFPLWTLPAFGWAAFCFYSRRKEKRKEEPQIWLPLNKWEKSLRWLAVVLAILAIVETGIHLITPQLPVSDRTLTIARRNLIDPKWTNDFDYLSTNMVWRGKPLKLLLDHVELAYYNRNELINWKVNEQIYQEFVLSPNISPITDKELNWRRPLWESFYPRVRKEDSPEIAAQIVVRYLRQRVTINPKLGYTPGIETVWNRQITDEKGFQIIYVAVLRSVGVGARLNSKGDAEFWTGTQWTNAPPPICSSFL